MNCLSLNRTNCYFKATDKGGREYKQIADGESLGLRALSIDYGKRRILNKLNHDFYKGRVCCVTGRNGIGKSTLLRTVCGFIKGSEGSIIMNGKSISSKELKKKAFMVMQDVNYQLFADSVLNECILGTEEKSRDMAEKMRPHPSRPSL